MSFFLYVVLVVILIWIAMEVVFEGYVFVSLDADEFQCGCCCSICLYLPTSKYFVRIQCNLDIKYARNVEVSIINGYTHDFIYV